MEIKKGDEVEWGMDDEKLPNRYDVHYLGDVYIKAWTSLLYNISV